MNDFDKRIKEIFPNGLQSRGIDTLQVNMGRYCNLACTHCHLECAPDRKEMMFREIMERILAILEATSFQLVDITGGSPELHPDFMSFISALRELGQTVQVRTNLTALIEHPAKEIIPFLRERKVGIVGSMPCYLEENVNAQRGPDVYQRNIEALRLLNEAGYGREKDLPLTLVYNPGGPFLPPDQLVLEETYRQELKARFQISFSRLIALTNMPLGRFRRYLEENGETETYMSILRDSFNPATVSGLMCRHQISVDWDGTLYDCDFNLALRMAVDHGAPHRIENFDRALLSKRRIVTGVHCFGCTSGAGSSCSGSLLSCSQE
jgi:radical SAM/Cys-rich protein